MLSLTQIKGSELINLFNQIFQNSLTGIISAENLDYNVKSKIFIKDSQIVYANSTMYHSRFGDIMIKKGIITAKELNTALKIQKEDPEKPLIGHILVEMGVISERLIPDLLYNQIELVIYEIIAWANSNIKFEEFDINKDPDYKSPVSEREIKDLYSNLNKLGDSKNYIKDLTLKSEQIIRIRQHLNNPDYVPIRVNKDFPPQLTFDQRKILRTIDGVNTINDIVILSSLDYVRTYQIIYNFAQDGIIKINGLVFDKKVFKTEINKLTNIETDKLNKEIKELQEKINNMETYFSSDFFTKLQKMSDEKRELIIKTFNNIIDLSL
ncbi:MAG: hypothetical protein U0354_04030 [Candidatus Sericytochromatia bacterium]